MSGWTGRRLKDSNMTRSGEKWAQEIINLFDRNNTLSEFNSGTYTGVSLFGLVLWSKYLPKDSIMAEAAPRMIQHTWESVGELWHPGMKNMAGPWDRSYGYDMTRYLSLMSLWFWSFVGKENSALISQVRSIVFQHPLTLRANTTIRSLGSCHIWQIMLGLLSLPCLPIIT